ncbi:MAG: ATP-grasp domain-containing protein, partial [Actinobacteria bacterium]|nr:ATP-grasp domain-containing protein [Actinomycetota bacterium]
MRGFAELQTLLRSQLGAGSPSDMTSGTLVVLPSISFPHSELSKIIGIEFYEERLLFTLLQLKAPDLRMVYVTSLRVEEPIVDYYLGFIDPEVRPGERLYLIALWDPRPLALSTKLLEKPEALDRLAQLAEGDSCLLAFNVTDAEREVAERIGVPLYGCPPDLVYLGSKSGSRQVARAAGVPVLEGSEDLFSLRDVHEALKDLAARRPDVRDAVIKLNHGFSGQGNAVVPLARLADPLSNTPTVFCATEESWDSFGEKVAAEGAIVEEMLRGKGLRSPSVQVRIAPDGSHEVISTHDQILGGPDDQVYLGCRFPASESYRLEIQDAGRRVAKVLAERGAMGSFGIDFVLVEGGEIYLSEINLRMGGTTH